MNLVIRGQRVVTPAGMMPATVHMANGKIESVSGYDDVTAGTSTVDAGNNIVMPGLVDTHVHINEPGRGQWEGFATATRAAAAGGVTTILDMPLNSIPATTSVSALEKKREAARGKTRVNVEYIGGVVPGNSGKLKGLAEAGVRAFKCFLAPSGLDEFRAVTSADLRVAFPILARLGLPLMVHAEDPAYLLPGPSGGSRVYADYLASRPAHAERSAIELLIKLMEWCPTPVHVVHLSSASSLEPIRSARSRGLPITVETCPHYLTFAAEEISDGATEYKCAPPIRAAGEREALWRALIDGDIDLIASDHSPCLPAMKQTNGDFFSAWGGIASLQLSLSAVWTGARERGIAPERIAAWMCSATAKLAGLDTRKGSLAAGYDADITIWNPDASFTVEPQMIRHRHAVTPYIGRELRGVVRATYVAGSKVFDADTRPDSPSRRPSVTVPAMSVPPLSGPIAPAPVFVDLPDLAAERLGGSVVAANDEFFAPRGNLIKSDPPEWREKKFTKRGKWMDGWETRRRRTPGNDWAIIKLGLPGIVHGVVIDTSYFTGNYPEEASVDAVTIDGDPVAERLLEDDVLWDPILPNMKLAGNSVNQFAIEGLTRVTHLRLNIFPDGGVARFRVHGDVVPNEEIFSSEDDVDLAALQNGGFVVSCSDMHYGNRQNLILPGRSTHMADGWETRRRRGAGHDWAIVRLARRGVIHRVKLDTDHFKGNAPGSCMLECCDAGESFDPESAEWIVLVPETPLNPDARHRWEGVQSEAATHVRLNIYPDGGVARLRLFGRAET